MCTAVVCGYLAYLPGAALGATRRPGLTVTRTPMLRSVCGLAVNAEWLASWGLQCGTTTTGTP